MATVTKYDVLSPDGFSISFDETWDTPDEASKALGKWVERYRGQGYYSTTNRERIPLDELTTWCTIVPIEVHVPEPMEEQLYSAIFAAEGRIGNGADINEAFDWLREDVSKIMTGEIIYD